MYIRKAVSVGLALQMTCSPLFAGVAVAAAPTFEIRSIDGLGNNESNGQWGSTGIRLLRKGNAAYADGVSAPGGNASVSARAVSNAVASQTGIIENDRNLSDFVWTWGQFVDHDMDLTNGAVPSEVFNIAVPSGDPYFDPLNTGTKTIGLTRSEYDPLTGSGTDNPRQQINSITAFLDASNVYGSDEARSSELRSFSNGKLNTSTGNLLPFNSNNFPNAMSNTSSFFLAGDVRANEQPSLITMHTLFVREHNRLADEYATENPEWSDEELYQAARRTVIAEIQAVTFNEFLPALFGTTAPNAYEGYDSDLNPGINNEFSTAAYRIGHTMLSPTIVRLNEDGEEIPQGSLSLLEVFFRPDRIVNEGGIEPIIRGIAEQKMQEIDTKEIDDVRNFLFGPPGSGGFDLASLNIQRGRDHGLPGYNQMRRDYGLPEKNDFDEITSDTAIAEALRTVYGNEIESVDPWIGGLAEDHLPNSSVGELFTAVILDQFERVRSGDRLWYENSMSPTEISGIKSTKLSDIILRNTSIEDIQENVFFAQERVQNNPPAPENPDEPVVRPLPDPAELSDPVLRWNRITLNAMAHDANRTYGPSEQNDPGHGARALGMVHAAIFDAVNSIKRTHQPYKTLVPVEQDSASVDAAVAVAAHTVLSYLYTNQSAAFDQELSDHLALIAEDDEKNLGRIVGSIVADELIEARTADGSNIPDSYEPSDEPGFHRKDPENPEQPFWGPKWDNVEPFVLESGSQFRAEPPPALTSEEYATAFNQVKSLGGNGTTTPTDRTEEQTEIGLYWAYDGAKMLGVPPRMYNQIAEQIASDRDNSVEENARLFALMNLAQADAGIAAWDSKYHYQFWRPVIGIREADEGTGPTSLGDGNAETEGDTEWTPLGAPASNGGTNDFTPPFPAYPSGHATFGASTLHTIALFYGTDDILFTFTSDEMNGITTDKEGNVRTASPRSFERLSDAIYENGLSRMYLGIHWIFDATSGIDMGNSIAEYTFANYLQPTEDLPSCLAEGINEETGTGSVLGESQEEICITAEYYDLSATVSAPASVQRGGTFTIAMDVTNSGPGLVSDASLSLPLPEGLSLNSVISGVCSLENDIIICNDIDIPYGSSYRAELELTVHDNHSCPAQILLQANVSASNDFNETNNLADSVSVQVDCEPENDLTALISGATTVERGTLIIVDASIHNNGPAVASIPQAEINLPIGASLVIEESSEFCSQQGSVVVCVASALQPESSTSFTVAFQMLSTLPCGTDFIFNNTVSSQEAELNPDDNISLSHSVKMHCDSSENTEDAPQTIEEIREQRNDESSNQSLGSRRGNGTNEALIALALLCQRNGMDMGTKYTGSFRVRGDNAVMQELVASDNDVIFDGFTETERRILCGMKSFMNQEDIPQRKTPEFREWMISKIAETLHKTSEQIGAALENEALCQ